MYFYFTWPVVVLMGPVESLLFVVRSVALQVFWLSIRISEIYIELLWASTHRITGSVTPMLRASPCPADVAGCVVRLFGAFATNSV